MFGDTGAGSGSRGQPLRRGTKALPIEARLHNLSLVLQTLYTGPKRSRAELSRATGLTRVTISDLVADLLNRGLVRETGTTALAGPGKPGTLLEFDERSHQVVALDLWTPSAAP